MVFEQSGCFRLKVIVFGKNDCIHVKVLVFMQNWLYWDKKGTIRAEWFQS